MKIPAHQQPVLDDGRRFTVPWWLFLLSLLGWTAPPVATNSPGVQGQIAYDGDYFYVATGKDAWKRTALTTW